MIFTQRLFFVFFVLVLAIYWSLQTNRARKNWLLLCSYLFYASWNPTFLTLIIVSTAVDFYAGNKIYRVKREEQKHTKAAKKLLSTRLAKRWLAVSLFTNLGLLATFKYFDFFISSGVRFVNWIGLPATEPIMRLILPVGISFYTFQTLSYTIDIYRGHLQPTRRIADFALFVAFFPQLVAGPIVRASDFLPQMQETKRLSRIHFAPLVFLLLLGFIKKACISDHVSVVIDPVFKSPQSYDWISHSLATVGYAVQIYCDFSGYSDIAIACAGMLGYRLPVNFHFPYFTRNIREFWQRWHISLSTWLRDYLYIPLGGNRGNSLATYRNLMVTMLLGGLWHGASWNFVLWGGAHGILLATHRFWEKTFPSESQNANGWKSHLTWLATLSIVILLWIPFRIKDMSVSWQFLSSLFSGNLLDSGGLGTRTIDYIRVSFIVTLFVVGHSIANLSAFRLGEYDAWIERLPRPIVWFALGIAWAVALAFANADARPFVYSQF